MTLLICRIWWGLFYVLTLGLITINSDDAEMTFIGWPYAIARWRRNKARAAINAARKEAK